MSFASLVIARLDGSPTTVADLLGSRGTLWVNVASECGLTPQYRALQGLHERYSDRGFSVVGVPCNQFDAQEPGTPDEIASFCSINYGVTFPLTEKVNVNPPDQHPVFEQLARSQDDLGVAGDIEWNFEKFLLDGDGRVVRRIRPDIEPDDPDVIAAIEALLGPR